MAIGWVTNKAKKNIKEVPTRTNITVQRQLVSDSCLDVQGMGEAVKSLFGLSANATKVRTIIQKGLDAWGRRKKTCREM